ncbi:MAG: glycosyltransferase family 4 protein [Planctomycetota bacterium]
MINLALYFTRDVGIEIWQRDGLYSREVEYYKHLIEHNVTPVFFTYDKIFSNLQGCLPAGITAQRIYANIFKRNFLYNTVSNFQLKSTLNDIDIIRTNQFRGAREALNSAEKFKKPLILRGGYIYSRFARWQGKPQNIIKSAEEEERNAAQYSSAVIVTTENMKKYITESYKIDSSKIHVIGNTIPDVFFASADIARKDKRLCDVISIGRHHPQKDYGLLLESLKGIPELRLKIIGSGPDLSRNKRKAEKLTLQTEFIESIENFKIPEILSAADIFIMTSLYEGHPKSLLEAMAAGCACIVTEGPGVNDEIRNKINGIVVPRDSDALHEAVKLLKDDFELRQTLGRNASEYIKDRYAIDVTIPTEIDIYQKILS